MSMIGKYRKEELLGKGGSAEVFSAFDTRLGRKVALKQLVLPTQLKTEDRELLIERFYQEARTTAHLRHQHILNIIDALEVDQQHYIVTEYVEGCTLDRFFENHTLSYTQYLDLFILLADAFGHAHESGVIHRDIKPDNIMLQPDGQPKIMDFGVAKQANALSHTVDGSLLGTIGYMAPEQLHNSKHADPRSDVYSFGAMMYQLLTGKLPFEADSIAVVISKIFSEPLVLPHELNKRIPPAVSAVIAQALCREPTQRYENMQALKRDLLRAKSLCGPTPVYDDVVLAAQARVREKRFEAFDLMGVLSGYISEHLTGSLHVSSGDQSGCIYLDQGQIQAVETDKKCDLSPIDNLYEIMCWETGSWHVDTLSCDTPQEDFAFIPSDLLMSDVEDCQKNYRALIDNYAHRMDQPIYTDLQQVKNTGLHQPRLKQVLLSLDGRVTLRELLERLPLDRLSVLNSVQELQEKDIIRF